MEFRTPVDIDRPPFLIEPLELGDFIVEMQVGPRVFHALAQLLYRFRI